MNFYYDFKNDYRVDVDLAISIFNMNRIAPFEFHFIPESDDFFRLIAKREMSQSMLFDFGMIVGKLIAVRTAKIK
jgi:hypothetical protein